jgi:quercetin dioxygenase-like cupin family protein
MEGKTRSISFRSTSKTVENPKGIFRTTMSYNEQIMLCHFILKKGAAIPLHNHKAVQNGYVINGKLKFIRKDGSSFIAETGTGYVFASEEYHGAEVLEDSEVIECFAPMRPEYTDEKG